MTDVKLFGGTVSYNVESKSYAVSKNITTADLNSLIQSAVDSATLKLDAGTFHLTSSLVVQRDDITIKGAGQNSTTLEADFVKPDNIINVAGHTAKPVQLSEIAAVGAHTINVVDGSKFTVGDVVSVSQKNDDAFINHTPIPDSLATNPYYANSQVGLDDKAAIYKSGSLYGDIAGQTAYLKNDPLRVTMSEITAINGNAITLKDGLAYAVTDTTATLTKSYALENVSLSGFTVTNNLGTPDMGSINNDLPAWTFKSSIYVAQTDGTQISDVKILNSPSEGITLAHTYGANLDNVTIIGSFNKGDAGNGYGLNLAGAQQGNYTDLTILDTRHAVVFSSWGAEVGNAIQINETNRDINYHGSPDLSNTVTVDKAILGYGTSSTNGFSVVNTGWFIHAFDDPTQNTTLFDYAVGYRQPDAIQGANGGSFLQGNGGNDILMGGAGKDVLIGGIGTDTLSGGKGADMFVFTNADGAWQSTDTVTDFNAKEGDKLVFFNVNSMQIKASDVHFTSVGSDTLVSVNIFNYTTHATDFAAGTLLKGVSLSQVDLSDVILNAKPYSEDAAYYARLNQPVADQNFQAHAGVENFIGVAGSDTVIGAWGSALKGDIVALGAGLDTLHINASNLWMADGRLPTVNGVDVLEINATANIGKIEITDALVSQSDHHMMTLKNDGVAINGLSADLKDASNILVVDSQTDVHLAGSANRITLSDDNKGEIFGGAGNDTIVAGKGADVLYGGDGNDIFKLVANISGKVDTIKDFTASKDVIDLSSMLTAYNPLQNSIDSFVHATTVKGHAAIQVDVDGAATGHAMQTVAILENMGSLDIHALIASHHLIV